MPLMDAQVALAAPAPLSDAMASAPEAAAPSSSPPASRSLVIARCLPTVARLPVDRILIDCAHHIRSRSIARRKPAKLRRDGTN
jgi:hypothetical protein